MTATPDTTTPTDAPKAKRGRLSQSDVPSMSVADALRIPRALRDDCGSQPTAPLLVAKALKVQPSSGGFRMLTGAASAYGLTDGAAQSTTIGLTDLGRRAMRPLAEGDDVAALREAAMKPRVIREFLQKYNNARFPNEVIAKNVLAEMGVPDDATERALATIKATAEAVGFLEDVGGHAYVHLGAALPAKGLGGAADDEYSEDEVAAAAFTPAPPADTQLLGTPRPATEPVNDLAVNKRVFITHGKDKDVVGQLEEVLKFGGFEAIVSVNKEATAKPVPDKVMDDMRSCAAGIVHVSAETLLDKDGNEHNVINPNVLIEIGAALALYKRNFILLVEHGVVLPSNLQGLYEVRYDGGKLDYEATMKLLRAFNEFKTN